MDCEEEPKPKCPPKAKPKPAKKKTKCEKPVDKTKSGGGAGLIEFPHFLRKIGPKQISVLMSFVPSALIYSVTSLILVTYASEWKAVLQYVPYYNGKYKEDSPKSAKKDDEEDD